MKQKLSLDKIFDEGNPTSARHGLLLVTTYKNQIVAYPAQTVAAGHEKSPL